MVAKAGTGLPVDESGHPAVDPSENVQALAKADSKRIDDLNAVRETLQLERIKRVEDLNNLSARHVTEMANLRADHLREMRAIHTGHDAQMHKVADDAIIALTERLKPVEQTSYERTAKGAGIAATWGVIMGVVSLVSSLVVIGVVLLNGRTQPAPVPVAQQAPAAAPQVYYYPAQPGTLLPSSSSSPPSQSK